MSRKTWEVVVLAVLLSALSAVLCIQLIKFIHLAEQKPISFELSLPKPEAPSAIRTNLSPEQIEASVGILQANGKPRCTSTLIKRVDSGIYLALTSSHCYDPASMFSISFPMGKVREAVAKPTLLRPLGLDIAVFRVFLPENRPVIGVSGLEGVSVGDKVEYIGDAGGLGLQYFKGYVSAMSLAPFRVSDLFQDDPRINWLATMAVSIGGGPGSSGSSLISLKTNQIIAICTGTIADDTNVEFTPVPVEIENIK